MAKIIKALLISLVAGNPINYGSPGTEISENGHSSLSLSSSSNIGQTFNKEITSGHLSSSSLSICSRPQEVSEWIKLSSLNQALSGSQVKVFANYFASAIESKSVDFNAILNLCAQEAIQVPKILSGLLTFMKEIKQAIPEVHVNIEGFDSYIVQQPEVNRVLAENLPLVIKKTGLPQEKIIKAFCLYLDAKARAEAQVNVNSKTNIDLQSIASRLNFSTEESVLEVLALQFDSIETKVIKVVPQILVSRTIGITASPMKIVSDSALKMQRQYVSELGSILTKHEYMSSSELNLAFNELDSRYSSCNYCKTSASSPKRIANMYASAGFSTSYIKDQLDVFSRAEIEPNFHYAHRVESQSHSESSKFNFETEFKSRLGIESSSKTKNKRQKNPVLRPIKINTGSASSSTNDSINQSKVPSKQHDTNSSTESKDEVTGKPSIEKPSKPVVSDAASSSQKTRRNYLVNL